MYLYWLEFFKLFTLIQNTAIFIHVMANHLQYAFGMVLVSALTYFNGRFLTQFLLKRTVF